MNRSYWAPGHTYHNSTWLNYTKHLTQAMDYFTYLDTPTYISARAKIFDHSTFYMTQHIQSHSSLSFCVWQRHNCQWDRIISFQNKRTTNVWLLPACRMYILVIVASIMYRCKSNTEVEEALVDHWFDPWQTDTGWLNNSMRGVCFSQIWILVCYRVHSLGF